MKNLAIGCGVVALVLVVGVGVVLYIAASRARTDLRESGVVESLGTLSKGVNNTSPFTPPTNGDLTPDTVRRFVAVHEVMVGKLGPRFNEIAAMQDDMLRREQAEHRKSTSGRGLQERDGSALAFFGL
jgi:hypothetical protein